MHACMHPSTGVMCMIIVRCSYAQHLSPTPPPPGLPIPSCFRPPTTPERLTLRPRASPPSRRASGLPSRARLE